jgi:hypothetical protein
MPSLKTFAFALTLPALLLLGCDAASLTGPYAADDPARVAAATSRLRAEVRLPHSLQSLEDLTIQLEIAYTDLRLRDRKHEQLLTLGEATVIEGLLPGNAMVTVSVREPASDTLHDRQVRNVVLAPGEETPVSFSLTYGGSSGLDLSFSFGTQQKDYRQLSVDDGLNADFAAYVPPAGRSMLFWHERDGKRAPVTFVIDYSWLQRFEGAGYSISYPIHAWTSVPIQAAYVDSQPLEGHAKVRHYRWINEYQEAPYSSSELPWREVTVDRWFSATEGFLKEEIRGAEGVISVLTRDGLEGR